MSSGLESIINWKIEDRCPDKRLKEIFPYSERANSVYARNKYNSCIKDGVLRISGAIDIMEGLEYHFQNFSQLSSNLKKRDVASFVFSREVVDHCRHEFLAYSNRVGQFYKFAKSNYVDRRVVLYDSKIHYLIKYKTFRDKHAAHRNIDWPKKDEEHIDCVSNAFGNRKGVCTFDENARIIYQIKKNRENYSFNLLVEHEKIMQECYYVISEVVSN